MKTVQSASLRRDLFKILDQIGRHGEPVEIMRHGKSVAVLGPSTQIPAPKRKPLINLDAIAKFCKQHQIKRFFLFGSVLRDDFDESSDVDVLIDTKGRRLGFREECNMLSQRSRSCPSRTAPASPASTRREGQAGRQVEIHPVGRVAPQNLRV
jgi:antitoxin (DNA-binding transcriptional repressor) of toxin-antitoxin stability system